MKKKTKRIKYKKERVILSDILPFEVPVTYSNRHLHKFIIENEIEFIRDGEFNSITWKKEDEALNQIVRLLFSITSDIQLIDECFRLKEKHVKTIPFSYKISHKENDFRELTIVHPQNQLAIIDFYEEYRQVILNYCGISSYSIRKPDKVARFTYYKDKVHNENLTKAEDQESIEANDREYENLKTFFVYKKYSNIHKFYESYRYHRCEKKYQKLFKFDISKCFDSIYTHSVTWALLNKTIVKDAMNSSKKTFGGRFDTLMQNLNYGETNGIVIGPEFSRIFAEIILQRIDKNIEIELREKKKLIHKVDYEIFRYVDDYFVFYNSELAREAVIKTVRLQLKEYKLYLNDAKTVLYEKPIITEITIGKQRVSDLLNKYLVYKIEKTLSVQIEDDIEVEEEEISGGIYVSSNRLITKFKTIIRETKIEYKDILNYTLALIERKMIKILKDYKKIEAAKKDEKTLAKAILEILDFTFFLYAVYPRVNTTIRLCRILRGITEFLNERSNINVDFKHLTFKKIYDNVYFTLDKNKSIEHTQVETLYLLIALGQLGKEYWLDADTLRKYLCIEKNEVNLSYEGNMNYFVIVVSLFYMRNKKRYNLLREFIKSHIKDRFISVSPSNMKRSAELVFLLFDCLSCPYLDLPFKKQLLVLHGIETHALQEAIIKKRKHWFTKWQDFDFGKELDAKHSQEVY